MVDIKTLLPELKKLVGDLSEDLLRRVGDNSDINDGLENAFGQYKKGGRTAQAYEVWLEDYLDQVAVAWVLSCVFVRFMEDNNLIDECYLAGEDHRRNRAEDNLNLFFRENPNDEYRDYFLHVFRHLGNIPACTDLFAEGKTPLWAIGPSGDTAMRLLDFWRERDTESGRLKRSLHTEDCDTRFLGDLYQDLSQLAKKKFALLQTPVFVEEFILDRTLTPALDEFGLEEVRMIDPTCGSGHFLLGGFTRLFERWARQIGNDVKAAQKALDGVWGVDINPFAVAIARFRLVVAAMQACGIERLSKAPGWTIHLGVGDSLLFGSTPSFGGKRMSLAQQMELFQVSDIYATEDRQTLQTILGQGYHVVVGNPPYITVKDKAQNKAYRTNFSKVCHRQYSLAVPFTQRFWQLAIQEGEGRTDGVGHIGMITANSFMKREFGKKLIEDFFPKHDLTHVVDTSGAYIPGHGTPTVILFGRNRKPVSDAVRAVLGIKGEPSTPDDPSMGRVWRSIVQNIDRNGAEDEFTSTVDVDRKSFSKHPWSLSGGGAGDIKATIEHTSSSTLKSHVTSIGFYQDTHADEAFVQPADFVKRLRLNGSFRKQIRGDEIRNWGATDAEQILFPYSGNLEQWTEFPLSPQWAWLWKLRTVLWNRSTFGGGTYRTSGRPWYDFHQFPKDRARIPLTIAFAFVATHNHFVLDRTGTVFNRSAPNIKLPQSATVDDHLGLIGLLNSSVACFWMKQVFHNKGSTVDQRGARQRTDPFEDFYEFTSTGLKNFPVAEPQPIELARKLDVLGSQYVCQIPSSIVRQGTPNQERLDSARNNALALRGAMCALQEELDWRCYSLYGLCDEELCYTANELPSIQLGERAFEIEMSERMQSGELTTSWFRRHGSRPVSGPPEHWPSEYRELVLRRIQMIQSNKAIRHIEQPEFKRRWNDESWDEQENAALSEWLAGRMESSEYWSRGSKEDPVLRTVSELSDRLSHDDEFRQVATILKGRQDFDLVTLVNDLVSDNTVPFLSAMTYTTEGQRKHLVWNGIWDSQRREDRDEAVGTLPTPPSFTSADFQSKEYARIRGKLDVPRERFIAYPSCEREGDPSLLIGWAGWDHVQRATAIVAYYDARKREGWTAERLTPLLAGLDQLLPWIHQWYPEIDPEYNETAGASFQTLLESETQELGLTLEDIRNWTPPKNTTRRKKKS